MRMPSATTYPLMPNASGRAIPSVYSGSQIRGMHSKRRMGPLCVHVRILLVSQGSTSMLPGIQLERPWPFIWR